MFSGNEANHKSFERYQAVIFAIPSSKLVLGDHPSSFLIFDESRLYRKSWPGLSSTNSIKSDGLSIMDRILLIIVRLSNSLPPEMLYDSPVLPFKSTWIMASQWSSTNNQSLMFLPFP